MEKVQVAVAVVAIAFTCIGSAGADDALDAKRAFVQRCTACHTFGRGVKVGPDLKGVTERRTRPWLLQWIRGSSVMIAAGDAVAVGLFQQFKSQRMPDWSDLSEKQVGAMLDWLAASGPEREADERGAETAGDDEIEEGRRLFHGLMPIANGGAACVGCHRMKDATDPVGGALGPDLSHAYTELRDRTMTSLLKRPCFPRFPESLSAVFLTPSESFALKSYLRSTALAADGGAP